MKSNRQTLRPNRLPPTAYRLRSSAFTLVELLVVIAIIGILIAMVLPGIQASRETAHRVHCTNQLTQLLVGAQNYEMAHEVFPPGTIDKQGPIHSEEKGDHRNWIIHVLPYIEETNAYRHIDQSVGVYDPKNAPVRATEIQLLQCPSDWQTSTQNQNPASNYAAVHHDVEAPIDADNHGTFFLNSHLRYHDIKDGASHTIFIGEKLIDPNDLGWMSGTRATLRNAGWQLNAGLPTLPIWTVPPAANSDDTPADPLATPATDQPATEQPAAPAATTGAATPAATTDETPAPSATQETTPAATLAPTPPAEIPSPVPPGVVLTGPAAADPTLYVGGFTSRHAAGVNFAFGDGSVRFIPDTISLQVLQQLAHRADGKLLSAPY